MQHIDGKAPKLRQRKSKWVETAIPGSDVETVAHSTILAKIEHN